MFRKIILFSSFSFGLLFSSLSFSQSNFFPWKGVIPEYSGEFIQEAGLIYYEMGKGQNKILVGEKAKKGKDLICEGAYSQTCKLVFSKKYPEKNEGIKDEVVKTLDIMFFKNREGTGTPENSDLMYKGLDEFVFASPNQEEAGSCLYMATTGAMEILLNKQTPIEDRLYEGRTDLSERFLMNVEAPTSVVPNWRTDTIYSYKYAGGALLNKDYRYRKGWHIEEDGYLMKSSADVSGAEYSTYYNWIDDYNGNLKLKEKMIKVPNAKRSIIFKDSKNDVWNTAQMPYETIEKIKYELKTRNAPVLVIYNHFAYWHAVLIVGYDDEKETEGCPFVMKWLEHMKTKVSKLLESTDPKELERAERYSRYVKQVDERMAISGCKNKGMFYVRDSIYTGPTDLMYDYDKDQTGDETPYSTKIVEKSYDWIYYLANHAYVIY